MSLNSTIGQTYLAETQALLSLLERYIPSWQGASTLEQRLLVEADAVATFERLSKLDLYMDSVAPGVHPDINDLGRVYSDYEFMLRLNSAKMNTLSTQFLKRFNSQQIALLELTGMMKRIRQKRAALSLWTRDSAKYVLAEHFLNFDALDSRFTSVSEADVDTNQGVLTLPILSKTKLVPKTARIGADSNGQPGNSDEEVQTNNNAPTFAVNGDPVNWFEYERMDVGPADLTLTVEFSQAKIINHLTIEPVNLGLSMPFDIVDITFNTSGSLETSIHDLVSSEFDPDFFTVKSIGNDSAWILSFLPIQASVVSFKFRQRQGYTINTTSTDNRAVQRKRFAIAIKDISLYQIEYDRSGGMNSKVLNIPGGLYGALPFADVWPQNRSFFTDWLEVSTDGGSSWKASSLPLSTNDEPSNVLMDGSEKTFMWRLSLERNDTAFANLTSFTETVDPLLTTKSSLRTVNRNQSPVNIPLSEIPMDGRVFAIQPRVARRGDRYRGIYVGRGGGQSVSFELPFSLKNSALDIDDLRVFVARREYERALDNTIIASNEWALSDDFREIFFGSALPDGSEIRVVFNEELLTLEERSDGYYHTMNLLFDPDKENIEVKYLPRDASRVIVVLPRNKVVIPFEHKYLLSDDFTLTSTSGTAYTEVLTKADVLASVAAEYYVDYVNGVLYLAAELGSEIVRATYIHQTEVALSSDRFDVVIENNVPTGIRIGKTGFEAQEKAETVGSSVSSHISIRTGVYGPRADPFTGAADAKTLTYDCVIKGTLSVTDDLVNTTTVPEEVDFIDGHTEFLGLIPMTSEKTVAIESGTNTWVSFSLSARSLWHYDMSVVFSNSVVFGNELVYSSNVKVGSVGDYSVSLDGTVVVNIGVGGILQSGIPISYFYRNSSFDPANKYSVDYKNGVLYTHTDMNDDAIINYRAGCYKASYDIAREIDTYSYDTTTNVVSVRTEGLFSINNLVKVIWTEAPVTSELLELKRFFSPLVNVLAFRMN